jgi:hypothetical protein
MSVKITIEVDDAKGIGIEATTPPVVTLGLLELAKSALLTQMTKGGEVKAEEPRVKLATPGDFRVVGR